VPLYEYHCARCDKDFEHRGSMAERKNPQPCPACNEPSARIEMSVFAISAGSSAAPSGGPCAGGMCATGFGGGGGGGDCAGNCACAHG